MQYFVITQQILGTKARFFISQLNWQSYFYGDQQSPVLQDCNQSKKTLAEFYIISAFSKEISCIISTHVFVSNNGTFSTFAFALVYVKMFDFLSRLPVTIRYYSSSVLLHALSGELLDQM